MEARIEFDQCAFQHDIFIYCAFFACLQYLYFLYDRQDRGAFELFIGFASALYL